MEKRKPISKKTRFEIFKRDKFTCQYCGKSAPNVILEVDHIKPVIEGGTDKITNLLTSCFDCNRGKGKRKLSDDSAISKSKKSAEELQEKRNQLAMMREWIEESESIDDEIWDIIMNYYFRKSGEEKTSYKSKKFKVDLIKLSQKLGMTVILESIDYVLEVTNNYCNPSETKNVPFWNKVYKRALYSSVPIGNIRESTYKYCMGIYRNKFQYFKSGEAELLKTYVMISKLEEEEIKSVFKALTKRCCNMSEEEFTKFRTDLKTIDNGE